jgi:dipeptide transport system substrate-binding protein
MKRSTLIGVFCAASLLAGSAAQAKTLVFCSEGSPENFYPAVNTTGTSFDANSQIYSRIVDFERGTTKVVPGLAERWEISADGTVYTFHLRKGVKWHSNANFKPTRDMNADDIIFAIERQWKEDHPYFAVTSKNHSYFNDMGMPKLLKSVEKVDDNTVKVTLNSPEAPFLSNLAMEYAGIQSKEYADAMLKAGTPEKIDQEPIGTGPFSLVSTRRTPSSVIARSRSTTAARQRLMIWCSPSRRTTPCAGRSCSGANATSCPIRTRPTSRR